MKPTVPGKTPPDPASRRALRFLREQGLLLLLLVPFVVAAAVLLPPGVSLTVIVSGLALVALVVALTYLRAGARRLREYQRKTQTILDTAADAILTADHRGIVLSFNAAAGRLFGRSAEQVIG